MKNKLIRLMFDREYTGELGFDLNEYDLYEDYKVNNFEVMTAIIMAILHDLSTVDQRLHISTFSHNAIQSELIDLFTNSVGPKDDDCEPDGIQRLANIDYRKIRELAVELSQLPSIEPLYLALKRGTRGLRYHPHSVRYVHDNIIVYITEK